MREGTSHPLLAPAFQFLAAACSQSCRGREGCHQIGADGDAQNRAPGLPAWLPYLFRGGQLAFPSLATEGEHLARNRGDCCKVSCPSWGLVGSLGQEGGDDQRLLREGRGSPSVCWGLKGRACSAQWGASGWRWLAESSDPRNLLPTEGPLSRARPKGDRRG